MEEIILETVSEEYCEEYREEYRGFTVMEVLKRILH